jgi:penicillin-binding protein 1C
MNRRAFSRARVRRNVAGSLILALFAALAWLVVPARVPTYDQVRAQWQPSEAWLLDRRGAVLARQRMDFEVRRFEWVALEDVSPAVVEAIVEGEDRRFWRHGGVDWRGVAGALRDTVLRDRRRGASTITMQVAQLLENAERPGMAARGPWRKLQQVRRARGLEAHWTKPQILEAYVNLLGFRGELQGIDAAAEVLAGKRPRGLDRVESAVLAALLPAPAASLEHTVARACARLRVASAARDCVAVRAAATAMLERRRAPLAAPALAPHLARSLLRVPGERVRTTLEARVQRLANESLARQLARVGGRNVRDGAVLVVDTATGDVLAYVGSARDTSRAADVDGVRALRQAGSTLKPFLYGLAIERGYLTAASLLDDSPLNLDTANGLYIPQNYDRDFKGPVSVRSALGNSLNVPAVRALVLTGVDDFRERLHDLGYAAIAREGDYYGYSLALGSAEVSLWQQAQAYRTLALGGRPGPLALRPDAPEVSSPGREVMTPSASFIVANMLADRSARVLTFGRDNVLDTPYWSAVKTGTSKDLRDNWCIGFSPRYLVAVWVGNFEGDSMHDVTGVSGAAPVWAELMEALHRDVPVAPPEPPGGVTRLHVAFFPAHEAARDEWFVTGTEAARVEATGPEHSMARIASPANATVIALDPDIPARVQRVPLRARGDLDGLVFELDGAPLGEAHRPLLWSPAPGVHRLALVDDAGRTVDHVRFTVH